MPAVSKKQQRFFGMVRAAQKGDMKNPSKEVSDVAGDISMKDAKKFAKTKHKGLPEKVKEESSCDSSYEKLKKKIGSKKMHNKPVKVEEKNNCDCDDCGCDPCIECGESHHNVKEGFNTTETRAKERQKFVDFYKKAKAAKAKKQSDSVRSDSKKHGIKFTDSRGSGRMRGGKKYYD